ncbi:MAG: hypothetical protein AAGG50_00500 [Bacteroidota bacterium]
MELELANPPALGSRSSDRGRIREAAYPSPLSRLGQQYMEFCSEDGMVRRAVFERLGKLGGDHVFEGLEEMGSSYSERLSLLDRDYQSRLGCTKVNRWIRVSDDKMRNSFREVRYSALHHLYVSALYNTMQFDSLRESDNMPHLIVPLLEDIDVIWFMSVFKKAGMCKVRLDTISEARKQFRAYGRIKVMPKVELPTVRTVGSAVMRNHFDKPRAVRKRIARQEYVARSHEGRPEQYKNAVDARFRALEKEYQVDIEGNPV